MQANEKNYSLKAEQMFRNINVILKIFFSKGIHLYVDTL